MTETGVSLAIPGTWLEPTWPRNKDHCGDRHPLTHLRVFPRTSVPPTDLLSTKSRAAHT